VIRRVRLQNFKSFKDATINLGLRNFLVGPNMSGKSNFLRLFGFLQQTIFPKPGVWGLPNAFAGGFSEWTWKGGDSNLIRIGLDGVTPMPGPSGAADNEWTYDLAVVGDERGAIRVQEERLSSSFDGRTAELISTKAGTRSLLNRDGREVFGTVDAIRAVLEFEIPDWDGAFLRQSVASWRFYRLVPMLMRQLNQASAPLFLNEFGDNLSIWLMTLQTRYGESFAKIQQVCRDVLPGFTDLFTSPTQQATVGAGAREKYLKRPVSLWEMSDGELAFIALLSLIFVPVDIGASLYCVEEPENYLHPKLIETVMELVRQEQTALGSSNSAQVIATTHSPHLIDKVSLDELLVFEKREGATAVTYPRDKVHLHQLLKSEQLGLGDLFYSGALQGG
jgi:predicted ATPase